MAKWEPIKTIPLGIPVLVWLDKPSLGTHVHSATFHGNGKPNIVGHHFEWDIGKAIFWQPQPDPPDNYDILTEAIDNPPPPNEALKKLLRE